MSAPPAVVEAVQAAILASAHLAAYEHVSAAALACRRLGSLTSGRWRSVARDLDGLEEELQTAYASAAATLSDRALNIGVSEEALWTAGDAASTLDLLREAALEELEDDSLAAKLLQGNALFGTSFVEDPDLPDRGTTLLFGWPEPLSPATWPWQANWVIANGEESEVEEDLDLFEAGEMEGDQLLVDDLVEELQCTHDEARTALREAALAVTRASLLASIDRGSDDDEDEEIDDEDSNGER